MVHQVLPYRIGHSGVHHPLRGDEGKDASLTDGIQPFGEEIVVQAVQRKTPGYVLANINLSSLERKERFRGKRGLVTDGRQTAHSRLDGAKLGSGIISCISLTLATLCQMEATCAHGWNKRKNGWPMMAESAVEDVPEWDA
ncbi:hypothetical protein [Bacteroides sp. MSSM.1001136sp1_RTP21357st2_E5_RTP21359_211015]|uniref:hypothetical protein n=1 Tax=unclassified Bacteroides TaxID=2646097 RepID=UPI0034A3D077